MDQNMYINKIDIQSDNKEIYPFILILNQKQYEMQTNSLVKDLIQKMHTNRRFDQLLVISKHPEYYHSLTDQVYTEYNMHMYAHLKESTCIFLDNLITESNKNDKFITDLFKYRYRHRFILIVVNELLNGLYSSLYIYDQIYLFPESNVSKIKKIYHDLIDGMNMDYQTFNTLIDRNIILIRNTTSTLYKLEENHTFYPKIPSLKIPKKLTVNSDDNDQNISFLIDIRSIQQLNSKISNYLIMNQYPNKETFLKVISEYNHKLIVLQSELI